VGGHSVYVRSHGLALRRAGFAPHVLCLSPDTGVVETEFGLLHRHPLPPEPAALVRYRAHQAIWRFGRLARAVAAFVRAGPGVRLIHGFGVFAEVAVRAGETLTRWGRAPVLVASAYDTMYREARAKFRGFSRDHGLRARLGQAAQLAWIRLAVDRLERRGYAGARLVLVNYESVRRLLAESYGLGDTLRRIAYASEAAFRPPGARPPLPAHVAALSPATVPLILAVSRHDPRKGVDVLLRALGRLRAAGIPFRACLLGTGPLLDAHRRLATRLGLDGAVAIEGFVADPFPYAQHADVFALPSLEEGGGSLSLLEALQAGVAVVASGVDGVPEDVTDGESALLVPPGDVAALQAALARVLRDPALRRSLAAAGRQTFEARFSADAFSAALTQVYASVGVRA
jgi:glycosyltransferase involved in cell wall biosynthesis